MAAQTAWQIAVVGAGPVGLALALHAARLLPHAQITLFDARPLDRDVAADPRTLALALGSVQFLQQLGVWPGGASNSNAATGVAGSAVQAITEVHVSQQPPSFGQAELWLRAAELGQAQLGATLAYGALVGPLQQAWLALADAEPARLHTRFGTPVSALKSLVDGVEVDAGVAERFDIAVVAEGGAAAGVAAAVGAAGTARGFAAADAATAALPLARRGPWLPWSGQPLVADYQQTGWVGTATLRGATPGRAVERFTRHGPAALLPLQAGSDGQARAALVWCVPTNDDPVRGLTDAQRIAVLNSIFPPAAGTLVGISALKAFPLGLQAERTLVDGRTVRIGNAAQTLHPVAGQGLNLGLRDAHELVSVLRWTDDVDAALRRAEWARAADRWMMIAATDFLARSFTWALPGAATARGLGLAALQAVPPLKKLLARRMMFGSR